MAHVPSLSTNGWIETVEGKADYLMSYFFTSQRSQSYLYNGNISSLPYIVAVYGTDTAELKLHINSDLSDLLLPYFDEVDIIVDVILESGYLHNIRISVGFIENDMKYDLAHLIKHSGGIISDIIKLNNG